MICRSQCDAVMVTSDLIDNITAILCWPDPGGQPEDVHDDIRCRADVDRLRPRVHLIDYILAGIIPGLAEPRPCRLEDLARAAGLSMSGVRIAYDDDEIIRIAGITGLRPRQRSPAVTRRRIPWRPAARYSPGAAPGPRPGRRAVHLVDAENLLGTPAPDPAQIRELIS